MSPTIHTSSLKASEKPIFKFSRERNVSESDSEDSTASDHTSSTNGSYSAKSAGFTSRPAARVSTTFNADLRAARYKPHDNGKERESEDEEEVELGVARLVQLPNLISHNKDGNRGIEQWTKGEREFPLHLERTHPQDRPAFPSSASVSLPTSSSTIDYLLYQHNSSNASPIRSRAEPSRLPDSHGSSTGSTWTNTVVSSKTSSLSSSTKVSALNLPFDYLSKYHIGLTQGDHENAVANIHQNSITAMMTRAAHPSSATKNADTVPLASNADSADNVEGAAPRSSKRYRSHDSKSVGFQFFHVEPCLYTHRMFIRAAKIFEVLKSEDSDTMETKVNRRRNREIGVEQKRTIPNMDFRDAQEQIKTFELTFATLKYQELFREILERTGFFQEFSNLRSDYSLVCIILYDLQSRKFQRRIPLPEELEDDYYIGTEDNTANASIAGGQRGLDTAGSGSDTTNTANEDGEPNIVPKVSNGSTEPHLDPVCQEIEDALLSRKTRLQSNIAKERIKRNAPTLEHLLPEQVRNKDETKSSTPVFCWVNQIKTTMDTILESLSAEGFQELKAGEDISEQSTNVFRLDPHCSDLLVFPPHLNMFFKDSSWVKNGQLVQQDKSSCLAPQTVQLLLGLNQDVIHVNVGTGMTTGHIASLLRFRSPQSHVWAFGLEESDKITRASRNLEFLGIKNVRIIQEKFLNVDPEESKYRNVRVIMITANCSKSAITSPVQFIVSEGEDMQILGELSQADSNMDKVMDLTVEHGLLLRHALKFPRVRAVVYTTRSRYEAENEQVVTQALEAVNGVAQHGRRVPFKVTPPVLPFSGDEIGTQNGIVDGRFACFKPTDKANGCFVATISREPEDPKDTARSAIARARSKGMLGKGDTGGLLDQSGDDDDISTLPAEKKRNRSKRAAMPETKSSGRGLRQKFSNHKTPAAIGARLYQAGLISRMEQVKVKSHKPEHVKVIKHPAPFSKTPQTLIQ